MVSRIYVEKNPGFDVEAQQLKGELLSLDVEPGFLLHVDTRDHWFLPS